MDLKTAPLSDFTRPGEHSLFTSDTTSGTHEVKINKIVDITGSDKVGTLKYLLPFDTTLDDQTSSMAAGYELYKISNLSIKVQSGSPLGTSSGALQMCYIPDPLNANFSTTPNSNNLNKAVRQAGSKVVRPRENVDEILPLHGTLWTKQVGTARLWSFGSLAFVVRSVPDAADYATFTITIHCTVQFIRTALVDYTASSTISTTVRSINLTDDDITIRVRADLPYDKISVEFPRPIIVKSKSKEGDVELFRFTKLTKMVGEVSGLNEFKVKQHPLHVISSLVDNSDGKQVKITGNSILHR